MKEYTVVVAYLDNHGDIEADTEVVEAENASQAEEIGQAIVRHRTFCEGHTVVGVFEGRLENHAFHG